MVKVKKSIVINSPVEQIVTESKGGIKSTWTFTMNRKAQSSNLDMMVEYTIPIPVPGKLAEGFTLYKIIL